MKRFPFLLASGILAMGLIGAANAQGSDAALHEGSLSLIRDGFFDVTQSFADEELVSAKTLTLDDAIYNCCKNSQTSVDISAYNASEDMLESAFTDLLNLNPELFYVNSSYSYSTSNGIVTMFFPQYKYSGDELTAKTAEFNANVTEITDQIDPEWSDLRKLLFIHDYLDCNYKYDTTYTIHYPEEFLAQKKGVCQAYTLTMQVLLNAVGIEGDYASSDTMNHIWNVVKLDGQWYHIDATWDDPATDSLGRARHAYFLLSDAAILDTSEDGHHDWVSDHTCTSTVYDSYFWQDIYAPFVCIGESWYCMEVDGIFIWDGGSGVTKVQDLSMELSWPVINKTGYYYTANYSGLAGYGGKLIYNTPESICTFDPVTKKTAVLYEPTLSSNYIYGLRISGATLTYALADVPYTADQQIYTYSMQPAVSEIGISAPPNVTEYAVGDTFLPDGLKLTLHYSDGASKTVDSGYTLTYDFASAGDKTVQITYEGCSVSLTVRVEAARLRSTYEDGVCVTVFEDGGVTVAGSDSAAAGELIAAVYDASGKMRGVELLPVPAAGAAASRDLGGLDGVARICVFRLGANSGPSALPARWDAA